MIITITVAICALVVVVADDERAINYEEGVKIRQGTKRDVNKRKSLWLDNHDGQETIQRPSASMSLSKDVAEMTPTQQKTVLEQLKQEESKLMAMLPTQVERGQHKGDVLTEEPEVREVSARAYTMHRDVPHDWSEGSNRVVDEDEYLPEDDEALMKELVEEEEEEKRREMKRQRQVELDEEEMERATAQTVRERVMQAHKRRNKAAAKTVQLQETRTNAATTAAANVAAASAAAVNAKNLAARVEEQVMNHVKNGMFPEQALKSHPAQLQATETSSPGYTQDLVTLKPIDPSPESQTPPADDPEITQMRAQLAGLQATLKADEAESPAAGGPLKAAGGPLKRLSEKAGIVEAVDDNKMAEAVHSKMEGKEVMQAEDTDDLLQPDALHKRVADLVSVEAPEMETSKESEAVPMFDTPVDMPDAGQDLASTAKDLADTISEEQTTVDSTNEKAIESDEGVETTSTEAEYTIVYYVLWGSVGALVIGLLGSLMYCVLQGPRDRPWNMPPKRQYS